MHRFFRTINKMFSLLSHTQSFFRFIRYCLTENGDQKLCSSPRIYIRDVAVFCYTKNMLLALSDHHTYLNADDASIFHQQKKVLEIEIC